MRLRRNASLLCLACAAACGSSSSNGGGAGGSSDSGASSGGGIVAGDAGTCSSDPLATGLASTQPGVGIDAFDCPILRWTAAYGEPDPMIFKAIIYVESRFDDTAVACTNLPCGVPKGWTSAESGCFGLMQVVPACGATPNDAGLLPNGQPNLETSPSAADWATSIFNPTNNIEIGIAGVADNRKQEMQKFPGCTTDEYTLMAIGDYNTYGSTKSCTEYNTTYDDGVLAAYTQYAKAAGYAGHAYP